jgi:hypothetical protein
MGVAFWLAEFIFYDRIFFQKSALHGYHYWFTHQDELEGHNYLERLLLNHRLMDINNLLVEVENPVLNNSCRSLTPIQGRTYTHQKPLTIAIIGDSVAYGSGIRQSQRFGQILEQKINKIVPTKVYNLAEVGNGIADYYALYRLARDYLHPDLVVVTIIENDLEVLPSRYPNSAATFQQLTAGCIGDPQAVVLSPTTGWAETLSQHAKLFTSTQSNYCLLKQSADFFSNDPQLFFYSLYDFEMKNTCEVDEYSEACLHRFIMSTYKKTLQQYGNTVEGHVIEQNKIVTVSKLEGHPGAVTHMQYADELSSIILEKYLANVR